MVDDTQFASHLYERIKSYVPATFKNCVAVSLNERYGSRCAQKNTQYQKCLLYLSMMLHSLRFLRYDPGQKFAEHYDGVFMRDNGTYAQLDVSR
jgi:hypothetical protein